MTTRILYQSFTDPTRHQPYLRRLTEYLASIAGPGVEYEVRGMQPADSQPGRMGELRCGLQSLEGVIAAEREGFDAVLIGHFQDSLLFEARTAVDIPVIGHGEASMHQACMLGGRIGVISIDPVHIPWHHEQVRRYGLESRVVDVRAMTITPDSAVAAFDDAAAYGSIKRSFVALAEQMVVDSGVDVVMSAGGLFALLSARDQELTVTGALVANPTLLAVRQVEAAVSIARESGTPASRGGVFAKATPQAIDEFLAIVNAPVMKSMDQNQAPEPEIQRSTMQYTAEAVADGNGRTGTVRTSDGLIFLQLGIPAEIGGAGGAVANPEQLFAAGYAACFMSALSTVARQHKVKVVDASVKALVTIAAGDNGFGLSAELVVDLPGVESDAADLLLDGAHKKCPYSKAVTGNIPVTIRRA